MASWTLAACEDGGTFDPLDQAGNYRATLRSDGVRRSFLVHSPEMSGSGAPLPVLIVFHGVPGSGPIMRTISNLDAVADGLGFVVAYPEAYHLNWAVGCQCTRAEFDGVSDVRFTRALIRSLQRNLNVDPNQVFVTGYSQGALMAQRLTCELSESLAGGASVAATMLVSLKESCAPTRPLPLIFFHGTEDQEFPREGREAGAVHSTSLNATLEAWSTLNGCVSDPSRMALPDTENDGTTVVRWDYSGCNPGGGLTLFDIQGGGHTWPGSNVDSGSGRTTADISASWIIGRLVSGDFDRPLPLTLQKK